MTSEEKITLLESIFSGRRDAYGAGDGLSIKEKVTTALIRNHLQGKKRIGIYPLSPTIMDGTGTRWLCIDIDEDVFEAVELGVETLEGLGFKPLVEISKSKGYHIWLFFAEPVPAKEVRILGHYIRNIIHRDYPIDIEVFPKQNQLAKNGFGNYVNLPLFGKDVPEEKTVFLDSSNGFEICPDQWKPLMEIVHHSPEELFDILESEGLDASEIRETSPQKKEGAIKVPEFQNNGEYSNMLPCVAQMMEGVDEGCRDVVAFTLAKHFRVETSLPKQATLAILIDWNRHNQPPLDGDILQRKVQSAYEGKGGQGYTSFGCDNELVQSFCIKEKCPIFQKELERQEKAEIISKSPYFIGSTFIPKRLADELMEQYQFINVGERLHVYLDGMFNAEGEKFIKEQCRFKLGESSRNNRLTEVISHIEDLTHVKVEELNRQTQLINVQNGMLDWKNRTLHPHSPEYYSSIRIPIEYNPEAICPIVDYFLDSTLPLDCVPIATELFGYALIAYQRFEKAFMFTGTGANGKSTFLTLLENFIGSDNVAKVPLQELDEHRFKRADLFGKLVNLFADLDARSLRSSTYFKTIVSGDMIDAERKHRDPFYFRPFARLIFSANEIPTSPDNTHAYFRRWCVVPFPYRFQGKDADKSLPQKLIRPEELSGLLNKALNGLNRLFKNDGFTESQTVQDSLIDYQKKNDTVTAFIEDCCNKDFNSQVERGDFYTAYSQYCHSEGYQEISRKAFYGKVRSFPFITEKGDGKKRYFIGLDFSKFQ